MVQRDAAVVWGVPRFLSSSPKTGGQGVEIECGDSGGGFRFFLDSRLRGNDKRHPSRVRRGAMPLCRKSEGVPQILFLVPQEWGIKGVDSS